MMKGLKIMMYDKILISRVNSIIPHQILSTIGLINHLGVRFLKVTI